MGLPRAYLLALCLALSLSQSTGAKLRPFSLADVTLHGTHTAPCIWPFRCFARSHTHPLDSRAPAESPDFKEAFDLNIRYLLMLSPDNVIYNFRQGTAGGRSRA